jgi:uncharacterized protein YxeA
MKVNRIYTIITCVLILLFVIIMGIQLYKNKSLKENAVYLKTVISDLGVTGKGSPYIRYRFDVNGISYKGSGRRYSNDAIGDSIWIVYDKTNPSNNSTYFGMHSSLFYDIFFKKEYVDKLKEIRKK